VRRLRNFVRQSTNTWTPTVSELHRNNAKSEHQARKITTAKAMIVDWATTHAVPLRNNGRKQITLSHKKEDCARNNLLFIRLNVFTLTLKWFIEPRNRTEQQARKRQITYLTYYPIRNIENFPFPAGKVADVETHVLGLRPYVVLEEMIKH
jgi:hypothetical protein